MIARIVAIRGERGYRQQHSEAVLGHIQTLMLAHLHAVVPGSALGKALHYMSAQWPKLSRYVEDGSYPGSYPIDNNPAMIRCVFGGPGTLGPKLLCGRPPL